MLVALAFAAAGCGGGTSAEEKWADQVCTPVQTWNTKIRRLIEDAKSAVASPGAGTIDRLKADARKAVSATHELGNELRSLPPAPGENGQTAKTALTSFANQMNETVTALKNGVSALSSSSNASQAARALSAAAGQISTFSTQAKTTIGTIQQTSSKLKSGFEHADSCKELRG
jgi:ABC-type transporter Mla subunit MlaD